MEISGSFLMKNDIARIFLKYGMIGSVIVHGLLIVSFLIYAAERKDQKEEIPENITLNTDIIDSDQLALLLSNEDEDAVSIDELPEEELQELLQAPPPPEEPEPEIIEEPEPEVVEEPEPEIIEEPEPEVVEEPEPEIIEEPEPEVVEEPEPEIIEEPEPEVVEEPEVEIEAPVIEIPQEEIVEEPETEEIAEEPPSDEEIEMTMLASQNEPTEKPKAPAQAAREEVQNKFNDLLKDLKTKPKVQRTEKKRTNHRALANNDAVKNVIRNNSNLFSQKRLKLKWKIPPLSPVLQRIYFPQVDEAIKRYWTLPPSLNPALENIVKVIIAKDGKIVSTKFLETSGNPIFDQFVKKVFKELKNLPPLPEPFPGKLTEISLRFTPARANTN